MQEKSSSKLTLKASELTKPCSQNSSKHMQNVARYDATLYIMCGRWLCFTVQYALVWVRLHHPFVICQNVSLFSSLYIAMVLCYDLSYC